MTAGEDPDARAAVTSRPRSQPTSTTCHAAMKRPALAKGPGFRDGGLGPFTTMMKKLERVASEGKFLLSHKNH